jgi:Domain of unknown function (DUF4376)
MTRFHATVNGPVPYTSEEEALADAKEASWEAGALNRAITEKLSEIAQERYDKEISGVTVGELIINTERGSQAMLNSTMTLIKAGAIESVNWKCENGYIALTPDNIDSVVFAVMGHVQGCFDAEKVMVEAVGGLGDDIDAINDYLVGF